ncbi:MAG: polysaccharide deacetylase family protein [Clostridiales bacterium]|nr:polysaccharide deacetylase family protein [Clostridiales bacterium]HBM80827.1 hypothetical protein [Clostridiaceae bacterium]
MSNRYLIVNADDFGVCKETNDAVEHLFNEGRITSTTVMAPSREAKDAVRRAVNNKKVNMGLHITLNSDYEYERWRSIAPPSSVSSILDDKGRLFHDVSLFYKGARGDEVSTEINAQYDFVTSLGYTLDHADSHCGTVYGITGRPFLKEAFELCVKYHLPFRFPKGDGYIKEMFKGGAIPYEIDKAHKMAAAFAQKMGVHVLSDMFTSQSRVRDLGSYENLKKYYINEIRNIKEGITEMFLHPSGFSKEHMEASPEWRKRMWEYQFLMDDDFLKTVQQEGINLVSWSTAPFDKF